MKTTSKVVSVTCQPEQATSIIRFDKTPFYPQGGGQPSDKGTLHSSTCTANIIKVVHTADESVDHTAEMISGSLNPGDSVELSVDEELRKRNCRLHSAGHVVDAALAKLNITCLTPAKAYHFEDGPYVEYDGVVTDMTKDELAKAIEKVSIELISDDLKVFIDFASSDPDDQKCQRSMRIDGFPSIPCGGTHVSKLSEIGSMSIRRVEVKKGKTRVCYAVESH